MSSVAAQPPMDGRDFFFFWKETETQVPNPHITSRSDKAPPREEGRGEGVDSVAESVADDIADIYRSCFRQIYAYCAQRLFCKDLAEDAASAVFARLVEQYARLVGKSRLEIRNWLYGTASNVVARCLKDRQRRQLIADELARRAQVGERSVPGKHLDWPRLYEAIGRLRRRDQDIVIMRFFQGLKTAEVADTLGLRHVTVRVLLSRAIKKLKRELGVAYEEQ